MNCKVYLASPKSYNTKHYFSITWIKEDNSLERCILVVVYLNILKGLNQLIQHPVSYPTYLCNRTVSVDRTVITCRQNRALVSGCVEGS